MTFTKTNEQLAARRARVKEMEMQGRVFNSSMRAAAIREVKRMEKIENLADNIIAGLQSNPNVKREVTKVQEVNYIDTTGFEIINLGSADKDSYSNSRRAEYSKNKKLENMADAILKELQSDSDEDDYIDDEKMDSILNSIRNEDEDDYIDEDENEDDNDEDILDDILNSIQNEYSADNNSDEDETDEDDNIDEDEMNSILNMVRNDNADNYMDENDEDDNIDEDEEVIVNNDEDENEGYYEFSEIQQTIYNKIVKTGYYKLTERQLENDNYMDAIESLIDRNIIEMDDDGILYSV